MVNFQRLGTYIRILRVLPRGFLREYSSSRANLLNVKLNFGNKWNIVAPQFMRKWIQVTAALLLGWLWLFKEVMNMPIMHAQAAARRQSVSARHLRTIMTRVRHRQRSASFLIVQHNAHYTCCRRRCRAQRCRQPIWRHVRTVITFPNNWCHSRYTISSHTQ